MPWGIYRAQGTGDLVGFGVVQPTFASSAEDAGRLSVMLASEVPETLGNTFLVPRQSAADGSVLGYTHVGLCKPTSLTFFS